MTVETTLDPTRTPRPADALRGLCGGAVHLPGDAGYDGAADAVERRRRPAAGRRGAAADRGRRARRRARRVRRRPAGGTAEHRARRRPARRGRTGRRRARAHVGDGRASRRPRPPGSPGPRAGPVGGRRRRGGPARSRRPARLVARRRRRRLLARRRARLVRPQARARHEQRDGGRARHRRRGARAGGRPRSTRTCSGRCAAAAAASGWSPRSSSGCYAIADVYAGMLLWDRERAPEVVRAWAGVVGDGPDEVTHLDAGHELPADPRAARVPARAGRSSSSTGRCSPTTSTAQSLLAPLRALRPGARHLRPGAVRLPDPAAHGPRGAHPGRRRRHACSAQLPEEAVAGVPRRGRARVDDLAAVRRAAPARGCALARPHPGAGALATARGCLRRLLRRHGSPHGGAGGPWAGRRRTARGGARALVERAGPAQLHRAAHRHQRRLRAPRPGPGCARCAHRSTRTSCSWPTTR